MPLYVYRCPKGHEVETLVKHDGSNAPVTCAKPVEMLPALDRVVTVLCGEPLMRVIAANAKFFPGADSWRK